MFFKSCEQLACEEPSIATLVKQISELVREVAGPAVYRADDIAVSLDVDVDRVTVVLDALAEKGGLTKEVRLACERGCSLAEIQELTQSPLNNDSIDCPACGKPRTIEDKKVVYFVKDAMPMTSLNPIPDGDRLGPGRPYCMLFCTANPDVTPLALDQEWRRISTRLEQRQPVVELRKVDCHAITIRDLRQKMIDNKPDLLHFSGHGAKRDGLVFADEMGGPVMVLGTALGSLIKIVGSVKCVVLNACYSAEQAKAIAAHVHCVVGMHGTVGDDQAIEFATGFYDGLTGGFPFGRCFDLGLSAIEFAGLKPPTPDRHAEIWIDGVQYKAIT